MSIPFVVQVRLGTEVKWLARTGASEPLTSDLELAAYADEQRAKANAKAIRTSLRTLSPRPIVRALSLDKAERTPITEAP